MEEQVYALQSQQPILDVSVTAPSQLLFSFADPTECVTTEESDETGVVDPQSDVLLASQTEVVTTRNSVELESAADLVGEASEAVEAVGANTSAMSDVIHPVTSNNYSTRTDNLCSTNSPEANIEEADMSTNNPISADAIA